MNVAELRSQLNKLIEEGKGELEVVVSSDAEGNSLSRLDELSISYCYEDEPIHPDDVGTEFDEEDLTVRVIVWPV
ncbi:hypothetical protein FH832_002838 [Listeria monocytogenes]|nr:hypothetical protein [Listeria monocytogenes]